MQNAQNALNEILIAWILKRGSVGRADGSHGTLDRPKPSERDATQIIIISGTVIIFTRFISTMIYFIIRIRTTIL